MAGTRRKYTEEFKREAVELSYKALIAKAFAHFL